MVRGRANEFLGSPTASFRSFSSFRVRADPAREAGNGRTPRQMAESSGSQPIKELMDEFAEAQRRREPADDDEDA